MKSIIPICLALMLSACNGSIETRPVMGDRSITPKEATHGWQELNETIIEWGGTLVDWHNLETTSEFQIIAYPLKKNGLPDLRAPPNGRFIASLEGYVETAEYTKGQRVTLSGRITGIRRGKVGEADYGFPLLQSDTMQLWPLESTSRSNSRINFGLGVGSGGHSRGSIGIGFGF